LICLKICPIFNKLNPFGLLFFWQHSYGRAEVNNYNGYHSYGEDDAVDHDKVRLLTFCSYNQGAYRSWKVTEFKIQIFQSWN